jgi:hypothetical protein
VVGRFSLLPCHPLLPRHDVLIDHRIDERFERWFMRVFQRQRGQGFREEERLHCVQTTGYRLWVFCSTGQVILTNPKFEMYL